jgi:hypothetical protein
MVYIDLPLIVGLISIREVFPIGITCAGRRFSLTLG